MLTSRPWLDPILMGEAKVLVEVKLDRPFPQRVALEDEDGSVSMVTVIYSWLPSKCPKCGQLGHKTPRCLGLPPIPVFKDSRFVEPPQTRTPLSPPVTDPIHHGSILVTEAQMTSHALSIDAQGCILLDQERNDEIPSNVPSKATAYNTDANVSTLQITHSASMETEAVPPISSPADNSTATNASPSDIACVPETTQLNTDSGFSGNITTSTSVSPSSSAPLDFATAGTLSLSTPVVDFKCKSSVDGIRDSCLQLSDAQGSNRFANLAMLEEDIQLDVVTSPSQPLSPSVKTSAQFVFNSSLPSTPPSFSDSFVDNVVASSSDSFDMVQRSRGGRCLKPSQKLKDMEWCTISGKGRRGRGTTPYSRRSH
ncbi:uncharacterized protein LOC130508033 [Raphanus sativus]|uniref:Uncharacterized protein LOC130508033 n=1 Tax=Raphanus sativus TaxID=3726 RepID=A0A9W3D5G4_RAPSA|nr:uncharacterized protein LOC130508033 [Raphanus sativus]